MRKIIFVIIIMFLLLGCTPIQTPKSDVLDQLKREDLAKASKSLPKNLPQDIPWYPKFVRVKDSGQFDGKHEDGRKYINPIVWMEVESPESLSDAKSFYRKALKQTRYKNFSERNIDSSGIENTQFDILLVNGERLKFNFISNYLGSSVVRIDYYKET